MMHSKASDYQFVMDNVCCWKGNRRLFQHVSHTLTGGELVQLEGHNGSGKTSLLRILAGLSVPEEGDVLWQRQSIYRQPDAYRRTMLYIGHKTGLKDVLTAYENLAFYQRAEAAQAQPGDIDAALERIGLKGYEDRPVSQLSAGQQRRVVLARLFLSRAVVWLLDEPFTAIDKQGVANLIALFRQHCDQGGIVLFTSHQHAADSGIRKITLHQQAESATQAQGAGA